MIGSIRGKLLGFDAVNALIEVNSGLGYEVEVPSNLVSELEVGSECFLYVHHIVREDADLLFGFKDKESRLLFRELIKVTSVGPRSAMAIISLFTLDSFIEVINQGRLSSLVKVPGVGKKTAERIIVEMKDRLHKLNVDAHVAAAASIGVKRKTTVKPEDEQILSSILQEKTDPESEERQMCHTALLGLGFKDAEASIIMKEVYKPGMDVSTVVKEGLRVAREKRLVRA
ncbi:MAG: Holliday junction branch migration protein RuvA [Candidatus Anaerobiospirillum pullicola]|uniref:Holliday junction branch migration complex subunit RuvA n=1 Tax=Candidatus Anaerobiospirillum pullicola TaxID=2838451 RepID=A0A948TEN4_9GAMM|nr:Holliday junction branch migration protein RuvA [Candidatus Anaerobiospirillum pullicola]